MRPETILVGAAQDPRVASQLEPSIMASGDDGDDNGGGTVVDEEDNVLMRSLVVAYREDHFELRRYKEVLTTIHPTLSLLCRSASFRNSSSKLPALQDAKLQEKENTNGDPLLEPSDSEQREASAATNIASHDGLLDTNHSTMVTSPFHALDSTMVEDLPDPVASASTGNRGEKSLSSVLTAFSIHNAARDGDDENSTPRYPLLHCKNLATFSPEELNYRWRCELCGIEGLRSREYWSHCLEDEHRRRALAVATVAPSSSKAPKNSFSGVASKNENKASSTASCQPLEDYDSHSCYSFEAGKPLPVLAATEDDDSVGGSLAEQWRMIDPLNELDSIDNDPSNDDTIEWNPPTDDQSLWSTSIRSILEETPSRCKRRYSADIWGSVLGPMEQSDDVARTQHVRRRSCPDVLSPMTTNNNASVTFSLGSPSFNLGIVGDLDNSIRDAMEDEDDTASVGPLALLSKLAFF